ncbi:uncharacterized protein LOC123429580 [Hordeum vulgare subsp. vulgare]|uniref:uncharacterized protein LOC123429580 n=1 Tax=Hordeum vulgare subsp. vulgare TaxID=112509 RepID=UPI001D1A38AB|nr:uncharacterized protein LOC123429580 [Hordeum vulgare subsp. vulgare]
MEMRVEHPSTRSRSHRAAARPQPVADAATTPYLAGDDFSPFSTNPVAAATACMRKRKRESCKRQDQGIEIDVYYGCMHEHGITSCVSAEELDGCKHLIDELPP